MYVIQNDCLINPIIIDISKVWIIMNSVIISGWVKVKIKKLK